MWKWKPLSCVRLFATPRTVAYQAPQSMEFSRQEHWSGLPFPSVSESQSHSIMSSSLRPHALYSPGNSPALNTWVGSLSLLHGTFPTQGSNPGLLCCRQILYQLSHKGSPRIMEWVAYPFSSGFFWPKNWTGVSCFEGRFFYQLSYQGSPIEGKKFNY